VSIVAPVDARVCFIVLIPSLMALAAAAFDVHSVDATSPPVNTALKKALAPSAGLPLALDPPDELLPLLLLPPPVLPPPQAVMITARNAAVKSTVNLVEIRMD
jgi:hypothetical protein